MQLKWENLCNSQIYLGFLISGRIGSFPVQFLPHKCFQLHQHGNKYVCLCGWAREAGEAGDAEVETTSVLKSQYCFFSPLGPTEASREVRHVAVH